MLNLNILLPTVGWILIKSQIKVQQDVDNVKIISALDTAKTDPVKLGLISWKGAGYQFTAAMPDGNYDSTLMALRRYSATDYVNGIYNFRKNTMWGVK
jgi:hypothetical protein